MPTFLRTLLAVVAFTVLFVGVTLLSTRTLSGVRADLTQTRAHTLSGGALGIVQGLDRPVRLTLFYSSESGSNLPEVVAHVERVRRLLRGLERAAPPGLLIVEEVDPAPFSEEEERAVNAGITQVRQRGGATLYFGLAGSNDVDTVQGIGYLDPALASRLEYDIARVVYLLSQSTKPRVGVLTTLPLDGAEIAGRIRARPWAVRTELARVFELVTIEQDASGLPPGLEALVVLHPKDTPDTLRYAIDQAVLNGLPVVVIVDPNCEIDVPPEAQQNPRLLASNVIASDLPDLLAAWGVSYSRSEVVLDRIHATNVSVRRGSETVELPYVAYLRLGKDALAQGVRALERLESLNIASAGRVEAIDGATTAFTPLVRTSEEADLIESSAIRFSPDPQALLRAYSPDGRAYALAASVTGPAKSAFPRRDQHHRADGTIRATVIADADMFADRFWVRPQRVGGDVVGAVRIADNAELLIGVLAEYVASDALLSIAPRERQVRVFERVQAMRREAQQRSAAEELRLREMVETADRRLGELGAAREGAGSFLLAEQRAEQERVRTMRADAQRRLRDVQYELGREIEALGDRVTLINLVAAPSVVILLAISIALVRRAGRNAERRQQRGGAA